MSCKPSTISMEPNLKLHANSWTPLLDPDTYRRLIGRLFYLTISRLYICYTIHMLSQFICNLYSEDLSVDYTLLRYLKHIVDHGILSKSSSRKKIYVYVDSD